MKDFLAGCGRLCRRIGRALLAAVRASLAWLSFPVNLCLAALAAVFAISLLSWAIADRYTGYVLFFPDARTGKIRGELRDLPRTRGAEAQAELIASEVLLGPSDPQLLPDFNMGTSVETVMLRSRKLYVDLSDDAAPAEPASIKLGLACLRKSLGTALPLTRQIIVTIGGREPYADYPSQEPVNGRKK